MIFGAKSAVAAASPTAAAAPNPPAPEKRKRPWRALVFICLIALTASAAATAGPLAPAPRVVVTLERDFLEGSGSQNLQELLDTGILILPGEQPTINLRRDTPQRRRVWFHTEMRGKACRGSLAR